MKGWDEWGYPRYTPKKPPPERGIKVKSAGKTWWGQRWIEALERMSRGYSSRLSRGKTYARAGRTHDLVVKPGCVTAKVTGSRSRPYVVRFVLPVLSGNVWENAIAAMAREAQFAAALLVGEMPRAIDAVFQEAGVSLFPEKVADLRTDCSCPDYANPCKHIAATHYVLGEALDRDPFLLFELRGRTRAQVLDALRAARIGEDVPRSRDKRAAKAKNPPAEEVPSVSLGRLTAAEYASPRAPLPSFHLTFEEPMLENVILRQLGRPPGWQLKESPNEVFGPQIRRAAERAREEALAEPELDSEDDSASSELPPITKPALEKARKAKAKGAKAKTSTGKRKVKKAKVKKTAKRTRRR